MYTDICTPEKESLFGMAVGIAPQTGIIHCACNVFHGFIEVCDHAGELAPGGCVWPWDRLSHISQGLVDLTITFSHSGLGSS